jgi:phage terminase Nu1 subunit (DNA packaging protein)
MPYIEKGGRGKSYTFNVERVRRWIEENAPARPVADAGTTEARRRYTTAAAELAELKLAEKRGSMVRIEDIGPILADELANCRSRLLSISARLAPMLVGMDQAAIEAAISAEVHSALAELTQG